jgi:hypothetical protein
LWCLMDGAFRSDAYPVDDACQERLDELKQKCRIAGLQCDVQAMWSNETNPIHLEFQNNFFIGEMEENIVDVIRKNRDRHIVFLMPCWHQLWLPGYFEMVTETKYPRCDSSFPDLYTSIEKANPLHSFLLGTATSACDSKREMFTKMIDMYLEEKHFVDGSPTWILPLYAISDTNPLPANYSGPISALTPSRKNHQCDKFLSDAVGNVNCVAVGVDALLQHSLLNNSAVKVLDMRGATEFGCNDTSDGVHYSRGLPLRRQLMILLRAMQSADKRY